MSARYRKKRRAIANSLATFEDVTVQTNVSITTALFKPPQTVKPTLNYTSEALTVNYNVVNTNSINTMNTVIFTLNNINDLITLYDSINQRINVLIDMIITKRDIDTIIQYAQGVKSYLNSRLETINDTIPSGVSDSTAFVNELQYLVIDILDDIINQVEIGIVERRVTYLIEQLVKLKIDKQTVLTAR